MGTIHNSVVLAEHHRRLYSVKFVAPICLLLDTEVAFAGVFLVFVVLLIVSRGPPLWRCGDVAMPLPSLSGELDKCVPAVYDDIKVRGVALEG